MQTHRTQFPIDSSFELVVRKIMVHELRYVTYSLKLLIPNGLKVFLYMYGTENNWTSIHLQARSDVNTDGFPRGSVRTFCLKGPEIGQLHHLNVNVSSVCSSVR